MPEEGASSYWSMTGNVERVNFGNGVAFLTLSVSRKGRTSYLEAIGFREGADALRSLRKGDYVTVEGHIENKKEGKRADPKTGRDYDRYVIQLIVEGIVDDRSEEEKRKGVARQPPPRQEPDLPPPDDGAPPPSDDDIPF